MSGDSDNNTSNAVQATKPCDQNITIYKPPIGPKEYIYNLLPSHKPQALTKYTCLPKIRKSHLPEGDKVTKYPMKTMGPPSVDYPGPLQPPDKWPYMKKHCKKPYIKAVVQGRRLCVRKQNKDQDEDQTQNDADGGAGGGKSKLDTGYGNGIPPKCHTRRLHHMNWITQNAIRAITQKPGAKVAKQKFIVDTRHGDKFPLKSERTVSGLEPIYVFKSEIGQVPHYLIRRKELIKETQKQLSHYINEKAVQNTDYLLTEQQRLELLNGLKCAWDRYNRKYLGLASVNDTLKGKAYKAFLEEQLDSLQKDIQMIENHQFLFVEAPKDPNTSEGISKIICA